MKSNSGDDAALLAAAREVFAKHGNFYGHPDENASLLTPEFATLLKRENACSSKGQICAIDSNPWLGAQDGGMSEPYRWSIERQSASDAAVDMTYVFDTGATKEQRTVQLKFRRAASGKWLLDDLVPPVGSSLATIIAENNYVDPWEHATITPSDIPSDAPRFEDYPAKPTNLPPVDAVVRTHPRSRMFRTVIRQGAQSGPNFAGHYTLISWGAGAGGRGWAIADAETGKVFHPENFQFTDNQLVDEALFAPEGSLVKFRLDSRLLIVIGGINESRENRGVSYFLWNTDVLKRIRFIAKPYSQ
ncbi:MAG TPA: hypothetical protein VF450_05000 [Noviherbaspirillum sp.]